MRHNIFLILFVFFGIQQLQSQSVGINLVTPVATLHVHSDGNTSTGDAFKITNNVNSDLLNVDNVAGMSIKKPSTNLRLDLRGSGTDNIIGIGTTTWSASAAQAGAIRYEPTRQQLQYSDGVNWYYLNTTIPRACVIAVNNTVTLSVPNNTETILGGWTAAYDPYNYFNSNGTFTAPRNGAYFTVLSFAFYYDIGNAGSEVEARWLHYRNGILIDVAKAKTAYTFGGRALRQAICYVSFDLQKGDVLKPAVWQNTGITQALSTGPPVGGSGGFNYLTVIIQ